MKNLKNNLKRMYKGIKYLKTDEGRLGLALFILLTTPISALFVEKGLEYFERTEYIQNLRKKDKEILDFQNAYLKAKEDGKVKYTHCGQNIPVWYIDIDGDGKQDGILRHVNGSTRATNCIGVYPIKKQN